VLYCKIAVKAFLFSGSPSRMTLDGAAVQITSTLAGEEVDEDSIILEV
jgi:hypothetical protein